MTQVHANNSQSNDITSEATDSTGHFDVRSLLKSTVEGKDPEQAAYGKSGVISDSEASTEFDKEVSESSSPLDDLMASTDETEEVTETEDSQEAASSESEDNETDNSELSDLVNDREDSEVKADIETVKLKMKDDKGRPQKLEVNYSDRKLIKRKFIEAAGMRKFQSERDAIKKDFTDIQSKYTELNDVYSKLDETFKKEGVKGLVNLLGQGDDPWKAAVDEELKHRDYINGLSPQEKYQLEVEEKQKAYEAQIQSERAKREEFEKKMAEKEEMALRQSLEAKLQPAFDRYRFAGKLNDAVVEHQFDEAIWNKVTSRLNEYPDEVELTQAIVDKEFRTVANNFRKMLNQQAEQKVKTTIEKKKADAGKRAQVAAKKGLSSNADKRKFVEDIQSGNIKDAFSAMFSGKVKL